MKFIKYEEEFLKTQNIQISELNKTVILKEGLPIYFEKLGRYYCYPLLNILTQKIEEDWYYLLAHSLWYGKSISYFGISEGSDAIFRCRYDEGKWEEEITFVSSNLASFNYFFVSINQFYIKYNSIIKEEKVIDVNVIKNEYEKLKNNLLKNDPEGYQSVFWKSSIFCIPFEDFGDYFTGNAYEDDSHYYGGYIHSDKDNLPGKMTQEELDNSDLEF